VGPNPIARSVGPPVRGPFSNPRVTRPIDSFERLPQAPASSWAQVLYPRDSPFEVRAEMGKAPSLTARSVLQAVVDDRLETIGFVSGNVDCLVDHDPGQLLSDALGHHPGLAVIEPETFVASRSSHIRF
jgi:hypothetical protein